MRGWGYFFMGIYVQKSIHVFLDCLWYSTIRGKMDFTHEHWISNEAYIITVMRFSCSYFCFGERRLVIMLKARCLSSSPNPKYRFWYSCLLWKMFSDEPEFEKKCWLWALNMRHSCVSYLGSFFFKGGHTHYTYLLNLGFCECTDG